MAKAISFLSVEEFCREMEGYREEPHMFFLGAGASITSGIPSAAACIEDWKQKIFESHNPGVRVDRTQAHKWVKIQPDWPVLGAPDEYAFYAQKCYPRAEARRQYFENLCKASKPSIGYQMLALMAKAELVKAVWTTNFDDLTIKATMGIAHSVREVCLDTADWAKRPFRYRELVHVALHGDYRYDMLKNLPAETKAQDETLRALLKHRVEDYPLVVIGYSGRDQSVMDTLADAYAEPTYGRLYWCGLEPEPRPAVFDLLQRAAAHENDAVYVRGLEFDELLTQLALHCLDGNLKKKAERLTARLRVSRPEQAFRPKPLPMIDAIVASGYASMQLASLLFAKAAYAGGPFPDGVWPEVSSLPGLRIDRDSITRARHDVIFRAWLKKHDSSEKEVWARVGWAVPGNGTQAGDTLEEKLISATGELKAEGDGAQEGPGGNRPHGVTISRIGRDTVAVYGSKRGDVMAIGRIGS